MDKQLLTTVVEAVDAELAAFVSARAANSSKHPSHELLWQSLQTVVLGGGKRLRPYLMVLAYIASGKPYDARLIKVATGWELIHQCMLIHDDIIDRDTIRHGQPNVGGLFKEHYLSMGVDAESVDHYANSAALLAGDLALSASYQLILSSSFSEESKAAVMQTFGEALDAVALGELQDTETAFATSNSKNALLIAELKTASYSFVGPLKSGAQLAEFDTTIIEQFAKYGTALGIAFQLRDDWLGVFGDPAVFGKSVDSDIVEGKRTLLIEYAYELAADRDTQLLDAVLGNSQASQADIQAVRQVIDSSGARARVEAEIDAYTQLAHQTITNIAMPSETLELFQQLERMLLERQK